VGRNFRRPEKGENFPKISFQAWNGSAKIPSVKLTIGLKLRPTNEQAAALKKTLERANAAANECSRIAWDHKTFAQFHIHKLVYTTLREQFDISAQLAVRVIAKVADAYKLDHERQRTFYKHGSIAFDDRILRYGVDYVSIWTVTGRQKIPFVCSERDRTLLAARQGESDLVYRKGNWYLCATVNVVEQSPYNPDDYLGIDLGIARIATDSDGRSFSGSHVKNLRKRHLKLRQRLQSKKTKSAKRRLRERRKKESLFAKDINHQIGKQIVKKAKRTNRAIALEELKGIRSRVRARKAKRSELHSWSFGQLRDFIEYKAKLAGVPVITVNPRNTSRECSRCGHVCKTNRRSQKVFKCQQCGHSCNADVNAARVIRSRAALSTG
jgi:putative transposase